MVTVTICLMSTFEKVVHKEKNGLSTPKDLFFCHFRDVIHDIHIVIHTPFGKKEP